MRYSLFVGEVYSEQSNVYLSDSLKVMALFEELVMKSLKQMKTEMGERGDDIREIKKRLEVRQTEERKKSRKKKEEQGNEYKRRIEEDTSSKDIYKLQPFQNFACRIILGLKKIDHISAACKCLCWLSVCRIELHFP